MPIAGKFCTTEGIPLFWARQCLSYSVVSREVDTPSLADIRGVVDEAFAVWGQVECDGHRVPIALQQTMDTVECVDAEYNPEGANANAVIFVSDWADRGLPSDAFGLTLVWHNPDTGEIFDADVMINDGGLGDIAICEGTPPVCGARTVDLQNVVTHEAGHYLGLGHTQDDSLATMAASAVLGETSKRTLANDDRKGVCAIYGDYAPVSCEPSDFQPNNGFSATCYFAQTNGLGCGACAALGATRPTRPTAGAAGALALFAFVASYRWRRRITASTSSPSPRNK